MFATGERKNEPRTPFAAQAFGPRSLGPGERPKTIREPGRPGTKSGHLVGLGGQTRSEVVGLGQNRSLPSNTSGRMGLTL